MMLVASSWSVSGKLEEHLQIQVNFTFMNESISLRNGFYISMSLMRWKHEEEIACDSIIIDYFRLYDVSYSIYPKFTKMFGDNAEGRNPNEICKLAFGSNENVDSDFGVGKAVFISMSIVMVILVVVFAITFFVFRKKKKKFMEAKIDNLYADNIEKVENYNDVCTENYFDKIKYDEIEEEMPEYLEIM